MEYLYGKLNRLVEAQKYKFTSNDGSIITLVDSNNNVDLSINLDKLVQLKQIKKDLDSSDDIIKYYGLFAYNSNTNQFDIPLGDEIKIDTSNSGGGSNILPNFGDIQIQVGVQNVYDDAGNLIGTAPKYAKLDTSISEGGNLIISQIPVSAIADKEIIVDDSGNQIEVQVQSELDGNVGGEVY